MGRAKQLSPGKRRSIIELKKINISNKDIANQINVSESAVSRLLHKFELTGTCNPKARSGRLPKISCHTERRMSRIIKANPFMTSSTLKQSIPELNNVSKSTICDHLKNKLGFKTTKPLKKPMMNKSHISKRLAFCREHRNWTQEQWSKVMWSDESTFQLFGQCDRFVCRPSGSDPCNPQYTQPSVKHPGSVMIWGCMSASGRGGLFFLAKGEKMNANKYTEVLNEHLLPFKTIHGTEIFMQDGAPCHMAQCIAMAASKQHFNAAMAPKFTRS